MLKILLFKYLFTENEKCLLNQALNLQRIEMRKEYIYGHSSDLIDDYKCLENLLKMCDNKLWN